MAGRSGEEKVPSRSTTTWVATEANTQIVPMVLAGTTAALATVSPALKLRFDTTGRAEPHGYAVRYPLAAGLATVKLRTATPDSPNVSSLPPARAAPSERVSATRRGAW